MKEKKFTPLMWCHLAVMVVLAIMNFYGVFMVFHDAFRRESDGKVFRVTKVNDSTPVVATFQFNQYQAEAWELAS